MRLDPANHRQRDRMTFALVAAAVLLGAATLAKVASFVRTQHVIAQVQSMGSQNPNDLQASLHKARQSAAALKKNNLFAKQAPKEHPIKQVDGILGSEVLIANHWYKVGGKVGDAVIVAIAPTEVTIEWDGQKKTFSPMAAASAQPGPPPTPPSGTPEAPKGPELAKPAPQAPVEAKAAAPPAENDPLGWLGVKLSPKLREMLLAKWNSASEEEKAKAKEEWNKMPEPERQKAIDMMEQNM